MREKRKEPRRDADDQMIPDCPIKKSTNFVDHTPITVKHALIKVTELYQVNIRLAYLAVNN